MNTKKVREELAFAHGVDGLYRAMVALCDELDRDQKAWEEVAVRAGMPSRLPSPNSVIGGPGSPAEYREGVLQFMAACDAAGEVAHIEEAPQDAAHYWRRAAEKWRQVAEKCDEAELEAARKSFSKACAALEEPDDGVPVESVEDPLWFWRAAAHHWERVVDEGPTAKRLERVRKLLEGR